MTVPANIPALMMAMEGGLRIKASGTGFNGSNSTSQAVALHAGVFSGDIILVIMGVDCPSAATTVTWPGGWTELLDYGKVGGGEKAMLTVGYKSAAGGETSVTVTSADSETSSYIYYIIGGAGTPEVSAGAEGGNAAPDPDNISPSGGLADYIFIAAMAADDENTEPTSAPSGYAALLTAVSGSDGFSEVSVGSAHKEASASSENPGTFTIPVSDAWVAATIAVPGA